MRLRAWNRVEIRPRTAEEAVGGGVDEGAEGGDARLAARPQRRRPDPPPRGARRALGGSGRRIPPDEEGGVARPQGVTTWVQFYSVAC